MNAPIETNIVVLKRKLGLAGRADFFTYWYGILGDIIYPDEQVTVLILSCVWFGCRKHGGRLLGNWKERVEENKKQLKLRKWELHCRGWHLVRSYECRANSDTFKNRILAALANADSITAKRVAQKIDIDPNMTKARIARIEAVHAVGGKAWGALRTGLTKSDNAKPGGISSRRWNRSTGASRATTSAPLSTSTAD